MRRISGICMAAALMAASVPAMAVGPQDSNASLRMKPMVEKVRALTAADAVSFADKSFTDMPGHWSGKFVGSMAGVEILKGVGGGLFAPDETLTVEQFITMMVKGLGYVLTNDGAYWSDVFIRQALDDGLIQKGEFEDYTRPITRAEMARLLVRMATQYDFAPGIDLKENEQAEMEIMDFEAIPNMDKQSVLNAYRMGLLTGNPDGTFAPQQGLTRAEGSTAIYKAVALKPAERPFTPTYSRKIRVPIFSRDPQLNGKPGVMLPVNGLSGEVVRAAYAFHEAQKLVEPGKDIAFEGGISGERRSIIFSVAKDKRWAAIGVPEVDVYIYMNPLMDRGSSDSDIVTGHGRLPAYAIGFGNRFDIGSNKAYVDALLDYLFEKDAETVRDMLAEHKVYSGKKALEKRVVLNNRELNMVTDAGLNQTSLYISTKGE